MLRTSIMMIDTSVNHHVIAKDSSKNPRKRALKLKRKALFHHHPKPKRFLAV